MEGETPDGEAHALRTRGAGGNSAYDTSIPFGGVLHVT